MLKPSKIKKPVTLKRLKNWSLVLLGLAVIFMAISFSLARITIKYIPDYSLAIQQAISQQLNMKFEFSSIDAEIHWLVPRLNLINVNVYDMSGERHILHLKEIDLSLDWSDSLRFMTPVVSEITLHGLDVELTINKKSELLFQNYIISKKFSSAIKSSGHNSRLSTGVAELDINDTLKRNINNLDFSIVNSQLSLVDERNPQRNKKLSQLNLKLINSGNTHVFEVKANLPQDYAKRIHFIIEAEGDLFDYKNLSGDTFLSVENVSADRWLDDYWESFKVAANANINAQIWMKWSNLKVSEIYSKINVSNLAVHYMADTINTWEIEQLNANIKWQDKKQGWQLDVRDLVTVREGHSWPIKTAIMLDVKNDKTGNKISNIDLKSNFLRIEGLVYIAGMINNFFNDDVLPWVGELQSYKPTGDLMQLDISLPIGQTDKIKVNTRFRQLGFKLPGMEPSSIENLQGSVAFKNNKTWVKLDSKQVKVGFNKLFRNNLMLKDLNGLVEISRDNSFWTFKSDLLTVDTPHISTKSRIDFTLPDEGRAFMDIVSSYENGEANYMGLYLPTDIMEKDLVKWLDKGIDGGRVDAGGMLFYGYLSDMPFRKKQGVFIADLNVSNVNLKYLDNWPVIHDMAGKLRFENDSLDINIKKGRVFGSNILHANAYIDNFFSPTLDIKGDIDTRLKDIQRYINESELKNRFSNYINNLTLTGKADLGLNIFLPLYGDYFTDVGGKLKLKNASMLFNKEKYFLTDINGSVNFAGDTVEATSLEAKLDGGAANINIQTSRDFKNLSYDIYIKGLLPASALLAPLPEVATYFKGSADWDISLHFMMDKSSRKTQVDISLLSDMRGVSSDMPGPIRKSKMDVMPVRLNISMPPQADSKYNLVINDSEFIALTGQHEHWSIRANTQGIKGNILINSTEAHDSAIDFDLDFLDLNKFFHLKEDDKKAKNKIQIQSKPNMAEKSHDYNILPMNIPSINFASKKLIWKRYRFNNSYFSTQKNRQGMEIKTFRLSAKDYTVTGKGSWLYGWNKKHSTQLDAKIDINNLGDAFKALQISDKLNKTSGWLDLHLQWQGMPQQFTWGGLRGDGRLKLKNGKIDDIEAGAGRILGLFNFKTLLSLDFGKQMSKGFAFDKMHASYTFLNGNVYSDDFTIESKVAEIYMQGHLDINNEKIDQKLTVRPHLDGTLSLGAAMVAGPTVGGFVYLIQKIFNTDSLSEYQYTVKGDIEKPVVTLLSSPVIQDDEEDDYEF